MTKFLFLAAAAYAQTVTLEMAATYRAPAPLAPVWSPDGGRFVYVEAGKVHLYDTASRQARALVSLEELRGKAKARPETEPFSWRNRREEAVKPQWANDGKRLLLAEGGDLFLADAATGKITQLTATPEAEEDPRLSPDGNLVGYRANNDLHVLRIANGKVRRLTFDGGPTLWNGRLDWVYPEELNLSRAWWWSPDSTRIAYLRFDVSREMVHPHVDASPLMARAEPQRFPKAGTPNAEVSLGVVGVSGGKTRWMQTGSTADALLARVEWMPGGRELAVQRLSRLQDRLELLAFDAANGKSRLLLEEKDPHWINLHDMLHFFDAGSFLWASERDGFRHLYLYGKGEPRQLTRGRWEVTELAGVATNGKTAYVLASREGPRERHLYAVDLDSGEIKKLSAGRGTHIVSMAPGGAWYTGSHSNTESAPRQSLYAGSGERVAELKAPARTEPLLPSEFRTFTGKDGTEYQAELIRPAGFDPGRKYPAIVMVYGGPHGQTVRDRWTGPNWDQALAHAGYVIWRMDNRGSFGRGHAFESVVHRRLGRQELEDQLEGVGHLLSLGFVDPARVGLHGWSYGGYMTLYAMTHSTVFAAGVAGAPVTDWRNYDTIYTERYMGLPARNEDGYKASSPVSAAKNLHGQLMLIHNLQDDNVLFQNSQHMMEALQRAGKHFDMQFYPLKSHGVTGPLRLHMLQAATAFFDRHLKR